MSNNCNIIGETGLKFFGKISASISHDVKNVLAVINENIGLLEDYTNMFESGKSIDPEKLMSLSWKIIKQIKRADKIALMLNRFAHSVDDFEKNVDLVEVVMFTVELSQRLAYSQNVVLEPKPSNSRIQVTTNPFFLQNLIWLCLDFAIDNVDEGKTIGIITEKTEKDVRIRFTHFKDLKGISNDRFPTEKEKALLFALKAELAVNTDKEEIIITWDYNSGNKARQFIEK